MAQERVAATVERELLAELGRLFPGERLVSAPDELYHQVAERRQGQDKLAIGVRPEAVLVARQASDGYFPAEAHIIERLGPYDIVDLKFGTQLFRSRTSSGYVKKAGELVWARLDEKQTHFFDDRSGESLRIRL